MLETVTSVVEYETCFDFMIATLQARLSVLACVCKCALFAHYIFAPVYFRILCSVLFDNAYTEISLRVQTVGAVLLQNFHSRCHCNLMKK